jgi:hypothetical protein
MERMRSRYPWKIVLLCAAGACFLLAAPCVFLGVLGLLGVVADVSPAENRQFGMQFLRLATIPLGVGAVILLVALAIRRSKQATAASDDRSG